MDNVNKTKDLIVEKIKSTADNYVKGIPIVYDFYKNNTVTTNDGNMKSISGFMNYNDDKAVIFGLFIIYIMMFWLFLKYLFNINKDIESKFNSPLKSHYLPIIAIILIIIANIKFWFYKNSTVYPDNINIWRKHDLPLPITIYFMLCMTQTIVSLIVVLNNNNFENWADFFIKYFLTIIFTYFLYLLVRNGYDKLVWVFAFLPFVLAFLLVSLFFTLTFRDTRNDAQIIDKFNSFKNKILLYILSLLPFIILIIFILFF